MKSRSFYKENDQSEKITQSSSGMNKLTSDVSDKYKGYELLLDIEELENEPELPPAKGASIMFLSLVICIQKSAQYVMQ